MNLKRIVEEQASEITRLQTLVTNSKSEGENNATCQNLHEELFNMHTKIVTLQYEKENLKIQNQKLAEESAELRNQNTTLGEENKKILDKNTALTEENQRIKSQNALLTEESNSYKDRYERLVNSKSWKVTQPLRNLLWKKNQKRAIAQYE